jgi:glycerol-3-phosphate dehydrogenase
MHPLSSFNRTALMRQMTLEEADLLIIGGGITGAGIALDAVSRGLKVALVEKQDFAAGTSSRSTKLIHGGLRYLKQAEFKLVHEVGSERAVIYRNAPHLVVPEKMLLPLVKNGSYNPTMTSFGLWLYDKLAGVKKEEQRKMLTPEQVLKEESLLRKDILIGGGLYVEYRTDDARLTLEVLKTAASRGALLLNYMEVHSFLYEGNQVCGAVVEDELTGKSISIKAKQIVNAAGPWVDQLRKQDNSLQGKRLHLTKGVHIVVPQGRLPVKHSVYFDVPDGRMVFAIPRGKVTYLGTTDTNYQGSIEDPAVSKADAEYLLDAANKMFPSVSLTMHDIISSWAGLRPLIHEDGKSTSELSRKDEIFISPRGLISIAGGKLTGYRKMAERVTDLVSKNLKNKFNKKTASCTTDKIIISGGDFTSPESVPLYIEELAHKLKTIGLGRTEAEYLVRVYGTQSEMVYDKIIEEYNGKAGEEAMIRGELWFCIQHEALYHASDFLLRRTGRIYFDISSVDRYKEVVLLEMQKALQWNEAQLDIERQLIEKALNRSRVFE